MKRVSVYLFLIVLLGGGFIGYWLYDRYFKPAPIQYLTATVKRGDLKELVRVRGQVVAEKETNLAFPFSGTVESVNVIEGQVVASGTLLMSLNTSDFVLELKKLNAQEQQARAMVDSAKSQLSRYQSLRDAEVSRLEELQRGARPEQLDIQQSQVDSAKSTIADKHLAVINAIQSAGTVGDDAIRNVADQLVTNPRSNDPRIAFAMADSKLERDIELQRYQLESVLVAWQKSLAALSDATTDSNLALAKTNLAEVKTYLDALSIALSGAIPSPAVTQTQLDTWRTNLSLARTNVNASMTNLSVAEAALRTAQTALTIAQNELKLLQAGTPQEQIQTQQAAVKQAEANIAAQQSAVNQYAATQKEVQAQKDIIAENIKKSSLYAPEQVRIVKTWTKANEYFRPGAIAITVSSVGLKLQSDISELDIPGVRPGNPVTMTFDALPDQTFTGSVIAVEPQEVVKDSDKYYRTNILLNNPSPDIRTGMSADVVIQKSKKSNVLSIPIYAVVDELGKKTARVLRNGEAVSVDIKTGITDGESIEVTSGLSEGDLVITSED